MIDLSGVRQQALGDFSPERVDRQSGGLNMRNTVVTAKARPSLAAAMAMMLTVAALVAVPASSASAQENKRLCGYFWSRNEVPEIGSANLYAIVSKVTKDDHGACAAVLGMLQSKIPESERLRGDYATIDLWACEDVAGSILGYRADICADSGSGTVNILWDGISYANIWNWNGNRWLWEQSGYAPPASYPA
jgi:hypothetical protein